LIHKGKKSLLLAKCHDQELQKFAMEGKSLLEFRNKNSKFRSYIQIYMNSCRFKLALSRIILKGQPEARWNYFIFLNSRTAQDLSNKICFTSFRVQINPPHFFELAADLNIIQNMKKKNTSRNGPNPPAAQQHRTGVGGLHSACGLLLLQGSGPCTRLAHGPACKVAQAYSQGTHTGTTSWWRGIVGRRRGSDQQH
jgi:hypothetical protein